MSGAIAGLALSVGTAGMSFAQAAKQNKLARQAERQANKMMDEARKKLEVKYTEAMSAQKQVYEQARESLLSTAARGIEAGMEGEQRGAAATVGRAVLGVGEAERGISAAQEQELRGIEKAQIDEAKALRDMGIQLDLGEVAGAQQAQAQAEQMAQQAQMQGITSAIGAVQQGIAAFAPTFNASAERQALAAEADLTPEQVSQLKGLPGYSAQILGEGPVGQEDIVRPESFDPSKIGQMSRREYRQFERALTPQQQQALFGSEIPTFFQSLQARQGDILDFMNPYYKKPGQSTQSDALLKAISALAAQQN